MGDVIDLTKYRLRKQKAKDSCVSFVNILALCLSCFGRWIGHVPLQSNLFMLQCPHCEDHDSFVSVLPDDFSINEVPDGA